MSRQREYLADASALQWTRSLDGLGGVLRKVMAQRRATHQGLARPAVQHMLLVDLEGAGTMERWLDAHPTLAERVQRIYGRSMQPLPLKPVHEPPETTRRAGTAAPGAVTLASLVDPFARL